MFKLWDAIVELLEKGLGWNALKPALAFFNVYLVTIVLLYEYIHWSYGFSPPLSLFLRSYMVKQASAIFAALAVLLLLVRVPRAPTSGWLGRLRASVGSVSLWRVVTGGLVLIAAGVLVVQSAPASVNHMRVKFLDDTDEAELDRYAFVYLLFELNKLQRSWYFTFDFDAFNENALTSSEREFCDDQPLCQARTIAGDAPLIAITHRDLGEDSFAQNDGAVSVISTASWQPQASPSVYEFLTYSVLVQSVLIHLNTQCSLPPNVMNASRFSRGDIFQFIPRRTAMKAEVLAAHLSPQGQELLMNCFGVEYLSTLSGLLTLDWLRAPKVETNLKRAFGVSLIEPPDTDAEPRNAVRNRTP